MDQHQRNGEDPTDVRTIYGRLLWRLQRARLTHGVRGVLWHQGENDQGAGPSGRYGGETFSHAVTPANLKRAYYTSAKRDEIGLEFGKDDHIPRQQEMEPGQAAGRDERHRSLDVL